MSQSVESFAELLAITRSSALHLEMRDFYGVDGESADFATWKQSGTFDADPNSEYWQPWATLVREAVARGVVMRRVRIFSAPPSEYIRFEHATTAVNIAAGEQVRWLPRRQASDLHLPGNDFWLFDDRLVQFNIFAGNGHWAHTDFSEDPSVIKFCASAFDSAWARATDHSSFAL
ncbi:DUF6879 family protein [Streptomyces sp. NPDC052396]|uniref:DUF6879 family protein n=1 Tax=Streptomyces sp. NPDC052396 TaxID=3365689 RepID=UPI0037D05358